MPFDAAQGTGLEEGPRSWNEPGLNGLEDRPRLLTVFSLAKFIQDGSGVLHTPVGLNQDERDSGFDGYRAKPRYRSPTGWTKIIGGISFS